MTFSNATIVNLNEDCMHEKEIIICNYLRFIIWKVYNHFIKKQIKNSVSGLSKMCITSK